ncbi:MAG: ParB/RepB/Spo0J family partition protein [Kiritimatiellae bacterium]|nr:ParB/RepB/Spo0J family partition protein [Kiritimatiellia bacterium]
MAAKHKGLGRGLDALIHEREEEAPVTPPSTSGPLELPLDQIKPNPWQPRRAFAPEAIQELAASIREMGLLQPLLVRKIRDGYELIAGERRLTAAKAVGLERVPVILKEYTDCEALEVALVENLQREDLNIMEEAEGYQALAEKFQLTQEDIARRVGKGRATVTNALRILNLPDKIKDRLRTGTLSLGHAKVLLGVDISEEQKLLADRTVREGLSVRALEQVVAKLHRAPKKERVRRADMPESHVRYLSDKLHSHFGTGVRLTPCATLANGKKTKGTLEIEFYSNDDLDRVLTLLGLTEEW